jgi:PBSX family phage portal protein
MMSAYVVPDDGQEIEVKLSGPSVRKLADDTDVFSESARKLNSLEGLDTNFKRRTTRTLNKQHEGSAGARSQKEEIGGNETGYDMFGLAVPPFNFDYLAKVYELSSAHYAAVNAKVANIVGLGYDFELSDKYKLKLEEETDDDKLAKARRKLARAKAEVIRWLESCHKEDDVLETLRKVYVDYETTGNGYLEVGRSASGEIHYIGHIPSTTMRIRKNRDGFVQIVGKRAWYFRNFGDTSTPNPLDNDNPNPNEVIHLKKYTPTNSYYGAPDIIAAMSAVAGNEFSSKFNLDYFENKAVPRYVIVIKGGKLSSSSEKSVHEFFQSTLRGQNHRTLIIPMPADEEGRKTSFEMKPVEAGTQDSSFNTYRKANMQEILMAHRVPVTKVSNGEGSLAAARDADKTFKEQVCRPEQRIFENKFNKVIAEYTDVFYFRLNQMTLTDEDTQSKIDERYLRFGVLVPNEVRARMGMPGREDGDDPWQANPQQAAEQKAQSLRSRTRDADRSANATDSAGEARSAQGEGRTQQ